MSSPLRRSTHEPRIEMTPLLDVIFLLLTFFIYSQVLVVRAELLPVRLPELSAGQAASDDLLMAITVDGRGRLYLNREPTAEGELPARLRAIANQPDPPRVYVAMEAGEGEVDRAPILLRIFGELRAAGINDFSFVGAPDAAGPPDSPVPDSPVPDSP